MSTVTPSNNGKSVEAKGDGEREEYNKGERMTMLGIWITIDSRNNMAVTQNKFLRTMPSKNKGNHLIYSTKDEPIEPFQYCKAMVMIAESSTSLATMIGKLISFGKEVDKKNGISEEGGKKKEGRRFRKVWHIEGMVYDFKDVDIDRIINQKLNGGVIKYHDKDTYTLMTTAIIAYMKFFTSTHWFYRKSEAWQKAHPECDPNNKPNLKRKLDPEEAEDDVASKKQKLDSIMNILGSKSSDAKPDWMHDEEEELMEGMSVLLNDDTYKILDEDQTPLGDQDVVTNNNNLGIEQEEEMEKQREEEERRKAELKEGEEKLKKEKERLEAERLAIRLEKEELDRQREENKKLRREEDEKKEKERKRAAERLERKREAEQLKKQQEYNDAESYERNLPGSPSKQRGGRRGSSSSSSSSSSDHPKKPQKNSSGRPRNTSLAKVDLSKIGPAAAALVNKATEAEKTKGTPV